MTFLLQFIFNNNLEIVDQNGNVLEQKGIGTQAAKRLYGKKGGLYLERDKIEELVKTNTQEMIIEK